MSSHLAGRRADFEHSRRCADLIEAYYRRQGYQVEVYVEYVQASYATNDTYPAVRSNLRLVAK